MIGKTKNYKFGNKNNWRRTVWNIAAKHIPKKKNAICVYVGDENDLDRPVAIKKGFYSNNLILVNNDKKTVKKIRAQNKLAILGDINEVIGSWNNKHKISYLNLDICSGLEKNIQSNSILVLLKSVMERPGVVCINLQRGRDEYSNDLRLFYKKAMEEDKAKLPKGVNNLKHRGFLLYLAIMDFLASKYEIKIRESYENKMDYVNIEYKAEGIQPYTEQRAINLFFWNFLLTPTFYSYKSGVIMDSLIIKISKNMPSFGYPPPSIIKLSNQINAVLAVRTMRRRRILPPAAVA